MRRNLRKTAAALVMLPLLLLAGVAQSSVLYRCGMDGKARVACCCPSHHQRHGTTPSLRAACCTTEVHARVAAAPATQSIDPVADACAATLPVESPTSIAPPFARDLRLAARLREPPPPRLGLVLLKSSLLI